MPLIIQDPSFDSTLELLREGYPFLLNRSRRHDSDIFQLRLLGEKAICLHGAEAAALFYDRNRFVREDAVPRRILTTLMGQDGVQTLDFEAHRCRKEMFMSLMTEGSRHRLMKHLAEQWHTYARRWEERQEQVVLFEQAQEILFRAACIWAGVPFQEKEVASRAQDFGSMIDGFGGVGPRHWRGKQARSRGEKWMRGIIRAVRKGKLHPAEGTAVHTIAWHQEPNGQQLSTQVAAVELMNVLRPIVAIATYITFAALALHEYPPYKQLLRSSTEDYTELFVQEVRRYFPFTPLLGARVRADFTWHGYHFPKGTLTLLDVYGTHRDERWWQDPEVFWPDRFRGWQESPFDFMPQGGGGFLSGHRCAGEWITVEAMKQAVAFLNDGLTYDVPPQDLRYDLTRMPTLPASGFVLTNVHQTGHAAPVEMPAAHAGEVSVGKCPFH